MIRAGMRTVFLILGTVMGAGYASGREIWQFFGSGSGLAIILFTILFIFCTTIILQISYQSKSTNYLPVLYALTGRKIAVVYDKLILVYLFCVTVVMLAGSGATFQSFGMPFYVGIAFIFIALLILFSKGVTELLNINQWLMPMMIIALFLILMLFMQNENVSLHVSLKSHENMWYALPFTALNMLPLIAVLGVIGNRIQSKGEIYIASITSGLILGIITYMYNSGLVHLSEQMELPPIPLYAIVNNYGGFVIIIMMLMLWLAIYTTAAATLLGLVTRMNVKYGLSLIKMAVICLIIMVPFSAIGFSQLIAFIYPLYGILNLYILFQLVTYPFWKRKILGN